jgi:predicted transcriptional regulator
MERKRNRLEIIRDILIAVRNKNGRIKPTQILFKSNLSHLMMKAYLTELIEKKFIIELKKDRHKVYQITDKGSEYLSQFSSISNFIESFGLGTENSGD